MRFKRIPSAVILLSALWAASVAHAKDLMIFDVRRPIALSNDEVTFKDFYINGGSESGLAAGMSIHVVRRVPLYDSYSNRSAGELLVKVAKVKIVAAQKGLAVARLHSAISRDANPILEDNFIMIGDQLDVSSASAGSRTGAKNEGGEEEAPVENSTAEVNPAEPEPAEVAIRTSVQTVQSKIESTELSSQVPQPEAAPAPVLQ